MDPTFESWNETLGIAIVQNEIAVGDPDGTFVRAMELLDRACKEKRPRLVVLPESFVSGFDYSDIEGSAEVSKRLLPALQEEAMTLRVSLLFSLPFKDGGRIYNRLFWIGEDGSVAGTYDKTHLFSRSGEALHFDRGSELRIFRIRGVPIGVLTCYELRYPELARALAVAGAGIIVYVGEWPASRVHQWDAMLRSRAVENQLYTAGANVCGKHALTPMGGNSAIIEPYGLPLATLDDSEGYCFAEIDRERILRFREKIPQESDRRTVGPVLMV